MSFKGFKRPLEPDSVLGVQPVSDSEDELSLPECLLLQPVGDDYSSDDEARKMERIPSKQQKVQSCQEPCKVPERKRIFTEHNNARDFTAAEVLFFWDLDILELEKEIDIDKSSTTEILQHIFKFVIDHELKQAGKIIHQNVKYENIKIENKSIDEIYTKCLEEHDMLAWLAKYDTIDFKNMSEDQIMEKQEILAGPIQSRDHLKHEKNSWMSFMGILYEQHDHKYDQHDTMKGIFGHIQTICNLFPIKANGEPKYSYKYMVPEEIASDDSNIFVQRSSHIVVKPDSIFTSKEVGSLCFDRPIGRIVVQLRDRVGYKDGMSLKEITRKEFMVLRYQNSSQAKCEVVKYLCYVDFIKRKDEICLKSATVEECLYHSLHFMSHNEKEALKIEQFKLEGKTIEEVCEYYTQKKSFPWQWIMEIDTKNLHDLTAEETQKLKLFFSQKGHFKQMDGSVVTMKKIAYASFVKAICILFEKIYKDRNEDELETDEERSDMVKEYLRELLVLLPYMNYRKSGECKSNLYVVVENPDLTPDNSVIEDRKAIFSVKPDGMVMRSRYDIHIQDYKDSWALPIQVYGSHIEEVSAAHSPEMSKAETEPQEMGPPPTNRKYLGETQQMRSYNLMEIPEYRAELRKSIKESIPIQCDTPHCMDKIAGQHVLQLLAMTQKAVWKAEFEPYNFVKIDKTGFTKSLGLFIVNEFVYFSKLLVEPRTMMYLSMGTRPELFNGEIPNMLKNGNMRPKMSYANFRFDLTIANHRKAFILFLNQFVDHQ